MDMRKWARWQDWVALIAGVVLALTPLWFNPADTVGTWTMVIVGGLLAISALWSLAMPRAMASEWLHVILGVLAFAAPWIVGYTSEDGAAWTSWVAGVIAVIAGLWILQSTTHTFRKAATQ